jgi:L-ascorbate metabolism protein UlaG (beta-lactamase superfamily)
MLKPEHAYAPLRSAVPDVDALRRNHQASTVTWVGHSTLLVQLDGLNILTDPTWSLRVRPWSGSVGVRRFTPPGITFDDLPPIDLVLISHDHYDHLDEATVRRLARAFNPRFVVPLGIKAWLADRGITTLPIGSYTPRDIARPVHMSPEEALQASLDLRSTRFIGIHWGRFELAREPRDEPPRRSAAEVTRLKLVPRSILLLRPGETSGW